MSDTSARRGAWVRIRWTVLGAGERAPQVPNDTKAVPLVARASGWLEDDEAGLGVMASVRTPSGRVLAGELIEIDPAPGHGFGRPVEELLAVGSDLRRRVKAAAPPRRDGGDPA